MVPAPPFDPPRSSSTRSVYQPLPPPRVTVGLPGGEVCLKKLALMSVAFQPLEEIRGIETPIQIQGPIGGIRYHSGFGPMVSDCRFALALATAAPELFALGVSEMRFSGAYSYRTSRVGRLSLHAYGLALDVHEIVVEGRRLSVEKDFARNIGCGVGPALNRVACRLRELGIFRELLTPDYNADHNNHFHLGVAPLGPLANELWVKRPAGHPSPRLPVFGNGSKTRAKPADPDTTDERRAERRRGAAATESKAKRERANREDASARRSKPVTKARKRKRPVADKPSKQSRVKAAKRNSSRDKDGNS